MKTKKMEKLILLEQSGELSPQQRRLLEACPEAQAMRDELTVLRTATPVADVEPDPWAVTKIAARLRPGRASLFEFSLLRQGFGGHARLWKPVFLTAACLMLVVSTFNFKQTAPEPVIIAATEMDVWNDQFEDDLVELESLILAISGDPIMEM